jgi:MSHA biogenesis protein MshQ
VPVTAEYWTGRSWLLNSDDSHTLIPKNSFGIKPTVSGMTVTSTFAANPLKLAGGAASFDLRVTAGGPGPVDIAVNLGSTLQDNACINGVAGSGLALQAAAIPWLRPFITGCNTSLFRDPSGRATFGVYTPEDRRLIHVREVFN